MKLCATYETVRGVRAASRSDFFKEAELHMKKAYVSPFLEEQKFTLLVTGANASAGDDNDGELGDYEADQQS